MTLALNIEYNLIQRQAYTILDYLGDVGGLLSMLNIVGTVLTKQISYFIYKSELFSELYQVKKYNQK